MLTIQTVLYVPLDEHSHIRIVRYNYAVDSEAWCAEHVVHTNRPMVHHLGVVTELEAFVPRNEAFEAAVEWVITPDERCDSWDRERALADRGQDSGYFEPNEGPDAFDDILDVRTFDIVGLSRKTS